MIVGSKDVDFLLLKTFDYQGYKLVLEICRDMSSRLCKLIVEWVVLKITLRWNHMAVLFSCESFNLVFEEWRMMQHFEKSVNDKYKVKIKWSLNWLLACRQLHAEPLRFLVTNATIISDFIIYLNKFQIGATCMFLITI